MQQHRLFGMGVGQETMCRHSRHDQTHQSPDNIGALDYHLTEENRAALNALAGQVLGDRYTPEEMAGVNK